MRRRHTSRALGALIAAIAVFGSSGCGGETRDSAEPEYCAVLPDSVGLYVGNPITQMGYRIGTIARITPRSDSVKVDFTLSEPRVLPADVKAVVRSTSIVADRALELVGNYQTGPQLVGGQCIPLSRSQTPKSLSEVIGSVTTFLNGVSPENSTNVGDVVTRLDAALRGNGTGINRILGSSSRLLDNPDAAVSDLSSIVTNLKLLTDTLVDFREPLKEILIDAGSTTSDVVKAISGARGVADPLSELVNMLSDIEIHAGDELQLTIDTVSDATRILSPHAAGLASLLDPIPWWINGVANIVNNHKFSMSFRPPLYRIRSPDGVLACNLMNASMPGSCANVAGQPYAVDINLLQYVFLKASEQ